MLVRLAVLVLSLHLHCHGHDVLREAAVFTVQPHSTSQPASSSPQQQQVKAVSSNGYSCTFSFTTRSGHIQIPPDAQQSDSKSHRVDLAALLESLEGRCVSKTIDYWTYQVCMGGAATQQHVGDSLFTLGTFDRVESNGRLVYSNGDRCPSGARSTTVSLVCPFSNARLGAGALQLLSVSEPRACEYAVMLGVTDVCGDDRFELLDTASAKVGLDKDTFLAKHQGTEDWMLLIAETPTGVKCSVRNNEWLTPSQSTLFSHVSMFLSGPGGEPLPLSHMVASNQRGWMASEHFDMRDQQLHSSAAFDGLVSFMRVQHDTPEE